MVFSLFIPILIAICIISIFFFYILPNNLNKIYKVLGLTTTCILLLIVLVMCTAFNPNETKFQFLVVIPWLQEVSLNLSFGVDGVSLLFVILTVALFPFCVLASWKLPNFKLIMINLLLIELFLILSFTALDLFLFCLFFESLLIPMFFIILIWGSRDRRIKALSYFFLYTLFGSVFLILALFFLYFELHTTSYFALLTQNLTTSKQNICWILLFLTFAIKIPMFPFHIWLPEAHVEAPTVGSVILAGLLLKIGAYGMLRFLFLFDFARFSYEPYILALCLVGIFIASFIAIRQTDMKRIIAYSSIVHMNFALLGYFSNTIYGLVGGTLLMVSHGIVSSALFLLIGVLYDRYHTRSVLYFGGLVTVMPLFAYFFFMFTISNISFPGTSNFIGELLVLIGLGIAPLKVVLILGAISTFFGLVFSILLYNRVIFGNLKSIFINKFEDLSRREYSVLVVLVILNILMGLNPNALIVLLDASIKSLVYQTIGYLLEHAFFLDIHYYYGPHTTDDWTVTMIEIVNNLNYYDEYHYLVAKDACYTLEQFKQELEMRGILMNCSLIDFSRAMEGSFGTWLAEAHKMGLYYNIVQFMHDSVLIQREVFLAKLETYEHNFMYLFLVNFILDAYDGGDLWTMPMVNNYLHAMVLNPTITCTTNELVEIFCDHAECYIVHDQASTSRAAGRLAMKFFTLMMEEMKVSDDTITVSEEMWHLLIESTIFFEAE